MIVAAPALVEAYAVLTRLPPPHRLSPQTALTLLENNFLKLATVTGSLEASSLARTFASLQIYEGKKLVLPISAAAPSWPSLRLVESGRGLDIAVLFLRLAALRR